MSIGADWRQNSPGSVAGQTSESAKNKFVQSGSGAQAAEGAQKERDFSEYMFGKDGFEFSDVLDVINPLQHIPGVGMLYRSLTGDEIGNGARVVGGGLFGGVFGLAGAAIDAVVDAVTGEDTGEHVMAFLDDSFNGAPVEGGTAVADASQAAGAAPDAMAANARAAADGTYQGDLVLPWMAGQQGATPASVTASAEEQSTIVQAAPVAGVDVASLDPAQDQNGASAFTAPTASDLNPPWAQAAQSGQVAQDAQAAQARQAQQTEQPTQVAQATQAQTASPQPRTNSTNGTSAIAEMAAAVQNDPAELAVAMASAGSYSPASRLTGAVATSSSQTNRSPIQQASFNSGGGDTVWARAQNSGRVSRSTNQFAVSPELVAHEARFAKLNAAKLDAEKAAGTDAAGNEAMAATDRRSSSPTAQVSADYRNGDAPLSAAEMAARFNAALGGEQARTMAAESASPRNPIADQGRVSGHFDQTDNAQNANTVAQRDTNTTAAEPVHPLMEEATSHIGAQQPVGAWFSQTMMDGLKKYQAMQQDRQAPGNAI
ncbi:hypothetical protein [Thalassospira lucentensis]|uniref:hypothetical protein n=1 Tax=Thalassospira lucentensis TaxID=168935 RepID=UPI00142D661E|nr:hypothetical protein [Thalassospira lucentensis]NIZ00722.1 hypothetical protein [Thalassospira lucentensis]